MNRFVPAVWSRHAFLVCLLVALAGSALLSSCQDDEQPEGSATDRTHKYESCSPNLYSDNMTMVAQAIAGGKVLSECEVAVFDEQGECRASVLSNATNGKAYLTIPGDAETGELSFRVVWKANGREYDERAAESLSFSVDAHVGSTASPFQLNVSRK